MRRELSTKHQTAEVERRPPLTANVQRGIQAGSRSVARTLQERLGNQGVQAFGSGLARATEPSPGAMGHVPAIVYQVAASPGRPLDAVTRATMEPHFGQDLSRVRVHTDSLAADASTAIAARAFTMNHHVAFAAGEYAPQTKSGARLLAHELTHVLQQQAGVHLPDGVGRPGDTYERHADAVAERVVGGGTLAESGGSFSGPSAGGGPQAMGAALQMQSKTNPPAASAKIADLPALAIQAFPERLTSAPARPTLQRQSVGKRVPPLTGFVPIPGQLVPGVAKETTYVRKETVVVTPELVVRWSLSLIGNVVLAPAGSAVTVTNDQLKVDFEKLGAKLTFNKGKELQDVAFKAVGVAFGPHKSQSFSVKLPATLVWSSKLPLPLVSGRMKVSGELRVELAAEVEQPPKSFPLAIWLRVGQFILALGALAARAAQEVALPIILLVPPVDDMAPFDRTRPQG